MLFKVAQSAIFLDARIISIFSYGDTFGEWHPSETPGQTTETIKVLPENPIVQISGRYYSGPFFIKLSTACFPKFMFLNLTC